MRVIALALALLAGPQDPDIEALLKGLSNESIEVRDMSVKSLIALGARAEAGVRAKMEASEGEVRELCKTALAGITRQKRIDAVLPLTKRVTLEARDRKAREILRDLQTQSGVPLEFSKVEDVPVTVRVKNATVLEAAAAVSKAAGLGFGAGIGKGATAPAIWFSSGEYVDAPRFFSGPFMIEILSVTLTRRSNFKGRESIGTVHLRMMWPPGVQPDLALLDVVSILDDKGRSLHERPERAAYAISESEGMTGRSLGSTSSARLSFKHPGDDAEKLGVIRGSALVYFAGEDRYLTFEATEKGYGKPKEMAGVAAELRGVRVENEVTFVTYATQGWPRPAMTPSYRTLPRQLGVRRYLVTLEDGTSVVSNHGGTRHDGPWRVEELRFPNLKSKVASVSVLAETVFHRETFDFELKDIPLPKY